MAAPRTKTFRWEPTLASRGWAAPSDPFEGVRVPWETVFGNHRPTEVEIGCGIGRFLVAAARSAPSRNFMGLERAPGLAAAAQAAIRDAGIANARALCGDARCVVSFLVPDDSVTAYHIYFPDPWWKRRHHKRRFLTPAFCAALTRTLAPRGLVHLASDIPHLVDAFGTRLSAAGLHAVTSLQGPVPPTCFAHRCLTVDRPVLRAAFERR